MSNSNNRSVPVNSTTLERLKFEKKWGCVEDLSYDELVNMLLDAWGTPSGKKVEQMSRDQLVLEVLEKRGSLPAKGKPTAGG